MRGSEEAVMCDRRTTRDSQAQTTEHELSEIVERLDLEPLQKHFLRDRWLAQLVWFEKKAAHSQQVYYALRFVTIAGGVTTAVIVSVHVGTSSTVAALVWTAFSMSLIVALSAALEGFLHYRERWGAYRGTCEALKAQGWLFFELAGLYGRATTHREAFRAFVDAVEEIVQRDVESYIEKVSPTGPDTASPGT
jgi:hypothetical protein